MCDETISFLNPKNNKTYFDATFGQGGYSNEILKFCNCRVIASDRDHEAEKYAVFLKKKYQSRFQFKVSRFSEIDKTMKYFKKEKVDGLTLDLGVSNTQIEKAERGFSFNKNGPLDMRMENKVEQKLSAKIIINNYSEDNLSKIFYKYGEERNSKKISKAIVEARKKKKIESTIELSNIINRTVCYRKNYKINPSTKTFQALRIYVNKELEELENCLRKSLNILNSKSRIIIVSFHSLEDKIVKRFFREHSGYLLENNRNLPKKIGEQKKNYIKIITKKVIKPSLDEIKKNPRARSARMRVAEIL